MDELTQQDRVQSTGSGHGEDVTPRHAKQQSRATSGRKARACHDCQRLKIRCEILPGDQRCVRCSRKDLVCLFRGRFGNDGPTGPEMEDYGRKLDDIRDEISKLQITLDRALSQGMGSSVTLPSTDAAPSVAATQPGSLRYGDQVSTPYVGPSPQTAREASVLRENNRMAMTRENSPEPSGVAEQSSASVLVTEPMGSLYEVTRLRNIRSNQAKVSRTAPELDEHVDDFITRGIIGEAEAEELYNIFHTSLNHYLWVGLEQIHTSLNSVRRSSQLLTATILTVTALHIPTSAETFDNCYREFLSLISSSMFSRYHSVDDVRGLCIAAFWLSDVSWKLSGHAIRVATELNIHNSFIKALEGDREHFLRARLWYMLYVCDHHFSIAYGRPPMISESLQIREHEQFLQLPFADALDYRILSQVALFQIMTRIHDCFAETRLPQQDSTRALLSEQYFPQLRRFNLEIDQWRIKWHALQRNNNFIGTFPPKGIILYSYFAKLQLNSFAIRGIPASQGDLSTERKEFVNIAVSSATSTLTFVLEEADMRRSLVGTPLYVHTMIAFASVFLMKVATIKSQNAPLGYHFSIDPHMVWTTLENMINLLKNTVTSDRHLLYHVAAGIETMLQKARQGGCDWISGEGGPRRGNVSLQPYTPQLQHQSRHHDQNQSQYHTSSSTSTFSGWVPPEMDWSASMAGRGPPPQDPTLQHVNDFSDDQMMFMNDSILFDAFGTETANDVYNLLSSQFS